MPREPSEGERFEAEAIRRWADDGGQGGDDNDQGDDDQGDGPDDDQGTAA
jgi:hypothetical protein